MHSELVLPQHFLMSETSGQFNQSEFAVDHKHMEDARFLEQDYF